MREPCFLLSDGQRRHVAVFLSRLEEALDEIERLATRPVPADRVLARERADLPAEYGEAVRGDVTALRDDIRRLAEALELAPRERSRARQARALLGSVLVQLEDAGARSLRAYGPLDVAAGNTVDRALDAMRLRLGRLLERLTRPDERG
jgi:hypothetical protein